MRCHAAGVCSFSSSPSYFSVAPSILVSLSSTCPLLLSTSTTTPSTEPSVKSFQHLKPPTSSKLDRPTLIDLLISTIVFPGKRRFLSNERTLLAPESVSRPPLTLRYSIDPFTLFAEDFENQSAFHPRDAKQANKRARGYLSTVLLCRIWRTTRIIYL